MILAGWAFHEVALDAEWRDRHGWAWGPGPRLWHASDGVDSLTVRADCPVTALAIATSEGWPPPRLGRFNWGREYEQPNVV